MMNSEPDGREPGDGQDDVSGEIVRFDKAAEPHIHARKDRKLKQVQAAFRAATGDRFKDARRQRRKRRNAGKGGGRKR